MFGRPLLVAAAILVAGLSLTACRPQTRAPCPAGERCLEYGNTSDPQTLDPQLAQTVNEAAILRELFFGLYIDGQDGSPQLGLAESFQTSSDGLTWTFKLKPWRWSDGVPLTADDFVFAYRHMLDPKTGSAYAYLLNVLKNGQEANSGKAPLESIGVKALDAETLQLTLAHPASYLPQLLKHQAFYPVPAHAVRRWGARWVDPSHYVDNGPYVLTAWRLGDYVRIQKNPYFAGSDKLCFDRVNFYPTVDVVAAEHEVLAGQLDLNSSVQSNRVRRLRDNPKSAPYVRTHSYLYSNYLALNLSDVPALKDIRVREAIAMAIDRDFIAHKVLAGAGVLPSYAFVPPGIAGYVPLDQRPHMRWSTEPLAQRQDEARERMAAAGYGPNHRLKLELKTFISLAAPVTGQAIQSDLKAIYIDIDFRMEDGVVVFDDYNQRNFQLGSAGWIADYNDPMTYLALMQSKTGAQNYGDYSNPRYDALLAAADNEPDGAKRALDLAQAEQMMLDDVNIVPLLTTGSINLINPNITGWVDNDADIHPIRALCPKLGWQPVGHN